MEYFNRTGILGILILFLLISLSWSQVVQVDIPNENAQNGEAISIPINVGDVTGLNVYSYQTLISYNPSVLNATAVNNAGTISASWGPPTANLSTPGIINLGGFGTSPLAGSGPLVYLEFTVNGSPGDTTHLHFQNFLFNAGTPSANTSDGIFTVTAAVIDITITSDPLGRQIEVDGTPVITPQIYSWTPGDNHTLNAPSPQSGGTGIRYVYDTWSNGGAQSQTITVPGSPTTYSAGYDTEYELTTAVDPAASGTITLTPSQNWFLSGATVSLEALPNAGYAFDHWSGDLTGSINPETLTMDGPKDVTAHFITIQGVSVTLPSTQACPGEQVSIPITVGDLTGLDVFSYQTLITFDENVLDATGASSTGAISAPWGPPTVNTATPGQVNLGGFGTTALSGAGDLVYLEFNVVGAVGNTTTLVFQSFLFNAGNPMAQTSNGALTVISCTVDITITSDPLGRQIEVDGTPVITPQIYSWTPGDNHTLNAPSPQSGGTGIRYVYDTWSNGGAQSQTITVPGSPTTYSAGYDTEYELTTAVDPAASGTITLTPSQNWFLSGATVSLEALPNAGYAFDHWSGDLTGSINPETLTMDGPKDVTAHFITIQGVSVTLPSTQACPGEQVSIPITVGDLTGLDVFSYQTLITFDENVLDATGASSTGAISAPWGPPTVNTATPGQVNLGGFGTTALSGAGDLVYLEFNVVGAVGNTTTLVFQSFLFNAGNPMAQTSNGALTVISCTVDITITSDPLGLQIEVDGTPVITPQIYSWTPGDNHTLNAPSPQSGGTGIRYVYDTWSNGGAQSQTITVPGSPTTYSAGYDTEYELTTAVDPAASGTITLTPSQNWFLSGATVSLEALPNAGYAFDHWSGDLTGSINPETLTMDGPKDVTAHFITIQGVSVTLPSTQACPGEQVSIPITVGDLTGLDVFSYQTLITFDENVLDATGASSTGAISAPWGPPTVNTATPGQVNLGGFGTTALSGAGDLVYLEFNVVGAVGNTTTLVFQSFLFNAGNPMAQTSNGALTVISCTVDITITSDPLGRQIEVDGTPVITPQIYSWTPGDNHTLNAPSPQSGGTGIRYVYDTWSNGGAQSQTITVPGSPTTYSAGYDTEYELTTAVDPAASGTITLTPSQNWFLSGATVSLEALPNAGYAFDHWSGDLTGSINPETLTMDGPKDVTAHFITIQGVSVTLPSTQACPGEQVSIPITVGDLTGLDVFSYQTLITFDENVLDATGASSTGAISAPWGPPTVNTATPGQVNLGGFGTTALSGAGDLVYLEFNVVGAVGNTTTLVFQSFLFNAGNPMAQTSNGALTVISCTVDITITSDPLGLQIEVDGTPVITPQIYSWTPGDNHTLNAPSPQSGGTGIRYVYDTWSNGGAQSQTITVPGSPTTYSAGYDTEYELTTAVDPAASGTITLTPSQNWFLSGATVSLEALPNAGYAFDHWSGDLTGSINPETLTMDGPKDVTAHFITIQGVSVTLPSTQACPGEQVSIPITVGDLTGLDVFSYQTLITFDENVLDATGASSTGAISAPWGPPTVNTATPGQVNLGGFGTTALSGAGDLVYLEFNVVGAVGNTTTLVFQSFLFNAGNPMAQTSNGALTVISCTVDITITSDPLGLQIEVDGTPVITPQIYSWTPGDNHTLNAPSPQSGGTGIRYVYDTWSNGGAQSQTITVPGSPTTYSAGYDTEYELTTAVDPAASGTITLTPSQNWFLSGATVSLEALPNAGYAFDHWSGDLTGSINPETLTMDGPKDVTAHFITIQGVSVTLPSTQACPGEQVSIPITVGDLTGLDVFSYQTLITFDENVLDATGASSTGAISAPWGPPTVNTATPGQVNLGGFGTTALSGAGDLVYLEFNVVGSVGNTTTLVFQSFLFNAGNPMAQTSNGDLTVISCTVDITITSDPLGLQIEVDGTPVITPQIYSWTPGDNHTLNAPSPQSGGTGIRYAYNSWSNGGTQSQTITVPGSPTTYSAGYDTEYELTTAVDPAASGTITLTPSQNWFLSGATVSLEALPNAGYAFDHWSGDLTGSINPETLTMDGPKDVTAHFITIQGVSVTLPSTQACPGEQVSIPITVGDLTGLDVFSYQTLITFDENVLDATGASSTGAISAPWGPPTVNTATPGQVNLGGFGTTALSGAGDLVYLEFNVVGSVGNTTTLVFQSFLFNAGNPMAQTSNGDLTVISCTVDITITSDPLGRQIEVDGTPVITPQIYSWTPGDNHTLNAPSPQSGGTGIRYAYNSWSNGGTQSQTITVPGSPTTYSAGYDTEYELTTAVDPAASGTITLTPSQNWFLSGATVSLEALPSAGYAFDHWSGDLTGSINPETLTMDGPKDVTAHFIVPQVQITIQSDPTGLDIEVDGTPVTTPQIFNWNPGDSHNLNALSPQSGGTGIQFVYNSWSNGGTQSQTITVPASPTTYTASYDTMYELTTSVDPTGGGTINITPNQTWFLTGSEVELEAVPTVSWIFLNWSGDLTGSQNPDTLLMDAPKNVIAVFEFIDKLPADLATQVPEEFVLYQNYPNPFNPETRIIYGLPQTAEVSLEVYDITGKKIHTLVRGRQQAGYHTISWSAQHLSSGMYLLKFSGDNFISIKKMILMK